MFPPAPVPVRVGRELKHLLVLMALLPLLKQGKQVLLSFTAVCQDDGTWHRAMPRCKSKLQLRDVSAPRGPCHPLAWGSRLRREEGSGLSISPQRPSPDVSFEACGPSRHQSALISAGLMVLPRTEFHPIPIHHKRPPRPRPPPAPPLTIFPEGSQRVLWIHSCSVGKQLTFLPLSFQYSPRLSCIPVFSPSQGLWAAQKPAQWGLQLHHHKGGEHLPGPYPVLLPRAVLQDAHRRGQQQV